MQVELTPKVATKFLRLVLSSYYQADKDYTRCEPEESEYCRKALEDAEDNIFEAVKQVKAGAPLECDEDFAKELTTYGWLDEGQYAVSYEEVMADAEGIIEQLLNPRWGESRFKNKV